MLAAADSLELNGDYYRLLVLQDITERVRIETELRQSQKMEAVGRLAAGVAHDFNNILTVILGNASMQVGNPLLDEKMTASLRHVVLAAERATTLTRQLLAYSRKQLIQRHPMSLNETVERTAAKLRRVLGNQITLELELAPDLPAIHADVDNVEQVIMNLALNSRDAMPDGGKLTLTTSVSEIDGRHLQKYPGRADGALCQRGRERHRSWNRQRDLEPLVRALLHYERTRERHRYGAGHSLWRDAPAQWLGGRSERGRARGHDFRLLPIQQRHVCRETGRDRSRVQREPISDKQITILVVEDEDLLREFVSEALQALGYRILSAPNGQEALEIWAQHSSEIDLLLTDIVMPKSISGRHLAHKLVMERPDLKVIFTSGYSAELIESGIRAGPSARASCPSRISRNSLSKPSPPTSKERRRFDSAADGRSAQFGAYPGPLNGIARRKGDLRPGCVVRVKAEFAVVPKLTYAVRMLNGIHIVDFGNHRKHSADIWRHDRFCGKERRRQDDGNARG